MKCKMMLRLMNKFASHPGSSAAHSSPAKSVRVLIYVNSPNILATQAEIAACSGTARLQQPADLWSIAAPTSDAVGRSSRFASTVKLCSRRPKLARISSRLARNRKMLYAQFENSIFNCRLIIRIFRLAISALKIGLAHDAKSPGDRGAVK